jgi:hypothetical protein
MVLALMFHAKNITSIDPEKKRFITADLQTDGL